MKIKEIIDELDQSGKLSKNSIQEIEENRNLRLEMVQYFDINKNRDFVLKLLDILTELRINPNTSITGDSLMLGCYILGKHNQIEDCMKIWDVKQIDFDTYCYVDIQLVPFAGVKETMEYLYYHPSEDAKKALAYMDSCLKAGDFDELPQYFKQIPWFV